MKEGALGLNAFTFGFSLVPPGVAAAGLAAGEAAAAAGWAGVEGAAALGVKVGAEGLKTGADGLKAGTFGLSLVGVAATAGALPAAAAGVEDIGAINYRRTAPGGAESVGDCATEPNGGRPRDSTVRRCDGQGDADGVGAAVVGE